MKMRGVQYLCIFILALDIVYSATKPNIVFILTDDQDVFINGTGPMAKLRKYIASQGATFQNMFVTTPLCCPSRSSILTGKYVHNHRAINNSVSGNCSSPAWQKTEENKTFVTYLKKSGYTTFFAGKYLNQYGQTATGGVAHVPPGWDYWNGLQGNSRYYNYGLSVNGKEEKHGNDYKTDYLTDVINRKATSFLTSQVNNKGEGTPFFMMLSTPSCHAPFTPAPQYSQNFSDMGAPRTPSFNTKSSDKHWLLRQVKNPMGNESMNWVDATFRNRWRTLLSVDDMVENVVTLLDKQNLLNNTYIFYASDNGYHLGQFSLPNDKRQFYEFDIRVPLMVRGPGVKSGQLRKELVLNIDLAPTFLELAGINPPDFMDGQSLKSVLLNPPTGQSTRSDFMVEHTGEYELSQPNCPQLNGQPLNNCFPDCVCEDSRNNTYICVRRLSSTENLIYCGMSDNEQYVEAYDLNADPDQLKNIAKALPDAVLESLAKSLATLATCSGSSCHDVKNGPVNYRSRAIVKT